MASGAATGAKGRGPQAAVGLKRTRDYPAGSAWTRRIGGGLAIAGIPEAASVFC
jgi:hypothetical protein